MSDNNLNVEENTYNNKVTVKKDKMPQDAIDKINRALEAGYIPGELEDKIYKEMFE